MSTRILSVFNLLKRVGFALLLLGGSAFSQAPDTLFTRTFGGPSDDRFYDVKQTSDGGFIACGSMEVEPSQIDAYVVKTDAQGNPEWQRSYGTSDLENAVAVFEITAGYLLIAWHHVNRQDTFLYETWVLRLSNNGDSLESKIYTYGDGGILLPYSAVDAEGCFAITGIEGFSGGRGNVWLLCINALGDSLWLKSYGAASTDETGIRITALQNGDYAIVGDADGGGFVLRVNSEGDSLWSYVRILGSVDNFRGVAEASDGSIIIGGVGNFDMWFVKLSAEGEFIWERFFGSPDLWDFCGDLLVDDQDNIWAACGRVFDFDDYILLRLSLDGDSITSGTWGGDAGDYPQRLVLLTDQRLVIAGYTESFGAGMADGWLTWVDTGLPIGDDGEWFLPKEISLSVYPNPFNAEATIQVTLQRTADVSLHVYDVTGRLVETLASGALTAGVHLVPWTPHRFASGTYFITTLGSGPAAYTKVILIK